MKTFITLALSVGLTAISLNARATPTPAPTSQPPQSEQASAIAAIVQKAMRTEHLRAVIIKVTQGDTRIEATCGKCGAKNRVSATPGQLRVPFHCKECGHKQATL